MSTKRCIECGSTTNPIRESDDEQALTATCMECTKNEHWSCIKVLSALNFICGTITLLIYHSPQAIAGIMTGILFSELIILIIFYPVPTYGEDRRRYKEWKENRQLQARLLSKMCLDHNNHQRRGES